MIPIKKNRRKRLFGSDKTASSSPVTPEEPKAEEKAVSNPAADVQPVADPTAVLNDKYLRLYAEYDNFRKRTLREKDALNTDITADVVNSFLPVYDDLERALSAKTTDANYRKGVEMIMAQFEKTLARLGITEIPALGQTFNPNVHNAVMHVEDENAGENEIVDVFQKGFQTGDKVIRPSTVKVAN